MLFCAENHSVRVRLYQHHFLSRGIAGTANKYLSRVDTWHIVGTVRLYKYRQLVRSQSTLSKLQTLMCVDHQCHLVRQVASRRVVGM